MGQRLLSDSNGGRLVARSLTLLRTEDAGRVHLIGPLRVPGLSAATDSGSSQGRDEFHQRHLAASTPLTPSS